MGERALTLRRDGARLCLLTQHHHGGLAFEIDESLAADVDCDATVNGANRWAQVSARDPRRGLDRRPLPDPAHPDQATEGRSALDRSGSTRRRKGRGSRHGAGYQCAVLGPRSDLDPGAIGLELEYDRSVAQSLHLARSRRALAHEMVNGHQLVAEHERSLAPNENVPDPTAGAALPLRTQAVDVPARDPNSPGDRKSTRLNSSHSKQSRMPSSA